MQGDFFGGKKCPICGKRFVALYPQLWEYKGGPKKDKFICSWKCLQKYNEPKTKGDHIEMATEEGGDYTLVPPAAEVSTVEKVPEVKKEKALEVAAVYSRVLPGRTYRKTAEGVALCGMDGAIILDLLGWIDFQGEIAQMILQLTVDGAEE